MAPTDEKPRTTEQVPEEQHTKAENEAQQVAEGVPVKIGYVLAAIAGVGLCVGAVVAVIGDTSSITTGGAIAAISAGLLAATAIVGLLVVFRRRGTEPAEVSEATRSGADSPNGKSRTSGSASAKRPAAARS
jgi:hypothetical protein